MSARKVLDSYALLTFLENESGADKISELIKNARDRDKALLISSLTLAEIYYTIYKISDKEAAENTLKIIETLPIDVVSIDKNISIIAAEIKINNKMPYLDCYTAALAKEMKAELITGNKDYKKLDNILKIIWI